MKTTLYAAYGSNLSKTQMSYRCPDARVICKSWLHDYRLVFKGRLRTAQATVIPEPGQAVPLVIWEISDQDEAALDFCEGVARGCYKKEYMEVEVDGEMKSAMIYVMNAQYFGNPTHMYFNTILRGYADFNLPTDTLNEALQYSYRNAYNYQIN